MQPLTDRRTTIVNKHIWRRHNRRFNPYRRLNHTINHTIKLRQFHKHSRSTITLHTLDTPNKLLLFLSLLQLL